MRLSNTTSVLIAVVASLLVAVANDSTATAGDTTGGARATAEISADVGSFDEDRLRPLPARTVVVTHHATASGAADGAQTRAGDPPKLVYSNTQGLLLYHPGRVIRIADDIFTTLADDCELSRFVVRVNGGVNGGGGTFDTTVSLVEECPNILPHNASAIPGTEITFAGLDDDANIVHELHVDYADNDLGICDDGRACWISEQNCTDGSACVDGPAPVIPPTVWLQVEFTTDDAGWLVGEPASTGFSKDGYSNPLNDNCNNWFGGYPSRPHASFWAEVYAPGECETHDLAYLASDPQRPPFLPLGGSENVRLADDINLTVNRCELSSYEMKMSGVAGPYQMSIDLRTHPTQPPIAGTERTFQGMGNGTLETARFTFDPGMILDSSFFITWQPNRIDTGVPNVARTQLGSSLPSYWAFNHPAAPGAWTDLTMNDGTDAIFHVAIACRSAGPPPDCPDGTIEWIDPPDGVVDARQPRDINDASILQGIDTIVVAAPDGADVDQGICWSLCETDLEGAPNSIASVADNTDGTFTITLDRRITPGAVTTVTYASTSDNTIVTGRFTSLPADSSNSGVSSTADILSLIDCCLNQVCEPPFGIYSCDIDHSQVHNTADILRLIDLLNGAGQFAREWNLAMVDDNGECD